MTGSLRPKNATTDRLGDVARDVEVRLSDARKNRLSARLPTHKPIQKESKLLLAFGRNCAVEVFFGLNKTVQRNFVKDFFLGALWLDWRGTGLGRRDVLP